MEEQAGLKNMLAIRGFDFSRQSILDKEFKDIKHDWLGTVLEKYLSFFPSSADRDFRIDIEDVIQVVRILADTVGEVR